MDDFVMNSNSPHPLADPPRRASHPLEGPDAQQAAELETETQREAPIMLLTTRNLYWTPLLIGLNLVIFVLAMFSPQMEAWLFINGAAQTQAVLGDLELHRLFTAMFLHANIAHIFFNMYALWIIGGSLERIVGPTRFILIYLLGGLAGSVASVLLGQYGAGSVGASGAVFAVWGAELLHVYQHRSLYRSAARSVLQNSAVLLVMNLLIGLAPGSRIDTWGHLGGLVGGAVLAYLIGPRFEVQWLESQMARQVIFRDLQPLADRLPMLALYVGGLLLLVIFGILFVV